MLRPHLFAAPATCGIIMFLIGVRAEKTVVVQMDIDSQASFLSMTMTPIRGPVLRFGPPEECQDPKFSATYDYPDYSVESSLNSWGYMDRKTREIITRVAYFNVGCAWERSTCCPAWGYQFGYFGAGWQPNGYPSTASRPFTPYYMIGRSTTDRPMTEDKSLATRMTTGYANGEVRCPSFSRIVYNGTITLEASSMRLYYSSLEVFKIVGTTSIAEYFWTCVWESVAQSTSGGTIYKHHNYLMADAMIFATSLPSRDYESEGLPAAVIAGVTVAVGVPMLLIFGFIAYRCQKRRPQEPSEPAISEKEKIDPVPSSTSIPYINEKC